LLLAITFTVALSLVRDTWPESPIARALTWPLLASAVSLMLVGRFVVGRGLNWDEQARENVDTRLRFHLVGFGVALLALFVVGRFVFDPDLAREGGVPGFARSIGLLMSGSLLVTWGSFCPSWLFLRESGRMASIDDSFSWTAVYTGSAWQALTVQSMLEASGFVTHVPDAYAVEPVSFFLSVFVPQRDAAAARNAIADYEAPAEAELP
jgi:hypothetical protein